MTSLKTDLLEKLKKQETLIKLQQIKLIDEIEFELEKKKRLEKDGSVIKLRTQLDELMKIIETPKVPNNYKVVLHDKEQAYLNDLNTWHLNNQIGKTDKEREKTLGEIREDLTNLYEKERIRLEKIKRGDCKKVDVHQEYIQKDLITFNEYMYNLSNISPFTINSILSSRCLVRCKLDSKDLTKNLVNADLKEKVYYDILPLFTTIIGIIEKQQTEIDTIKKQKEVTNMYARAKLHH